MLKFTLTRFVSHLLLPSLVMSIGLISCGGSKSVKYVDLDGKGTIALVSYSLDKSIVRKGDSRDEGPGLLQKALKGKEKAENEYFEEETNALNGIYEKFKEQFTTVFGNVPCMEISAVTGNEVYKTESKYEPKKVLGTDVSLGANYLNPQDLNYLSITDTAKLNKIASALNVNLLLIVQNSAEYDLAKGAGIKMGEISVSAGSAKIYLTSHFYLYDSKSGVIINQTFTNSSNEDIPMISNFIDRSAFPQCALSAHQKNVDAFKAYIQTQKEKAKQQAAVPAK